MASRIHRLPSQLATFAVLIGSLAGASGALSQERIFVGQLSPSGLSAFSFDGTSFAIEDPTPASAGTFEPTAFDASAADATDRWFLIGLQGTGVSLSLMDPASGVQLPFVSDLVGGGGTVVASASGDYAYAVGAGVTGAELIVYDLRVSVPATFRTVLPGRVTVGAGETVGGVVRDPARTRLYVATTSGSFTGTRLRVYDIATSETAPALLETETIGFSSPGNVGPLFDLKYLSAGGSSWIGIGRRYIQLVPLVGGLLDAPSTLEAYSNHPTIGGRRRVMSLHAATTPSGDRLFVATDIYNDPALGVRSEEELLVYDLATFPAGPLHTVTLTSNGDGDDGGPKLKPSLAGDYLYAFNPGSSANLPEYDSCKLAAFDLDALAAGATGPIDTIDLDAAAPVEVCGASGTWRVATPPPAPPAGISITDVVVTGATPDHLVVNDAPRTLTITGAGFTSPMYAYLGEVVLSGVTVSSPTEIVATVPALAPSGNPRLLLLDGAGALAAWGGAGAPETLAVVNPPQFLPGSRVYATAFGRNEVVELNGATANEVLGSFPSGLGPNRGIATEDGKLGVIGGFRDSRLHVHALVADAERGFGWHEEVANPYATFILDFAVDSARRRVYAGGICWVSVLDLEPDPGDPTVRPALVDTDSDPGTTDFPDRVPFEPEEAGITRILLWDAPNDDCYNVSRKIVVSPDGNWLYLTPNSAPHLLAVRLHAHADPDVVDSATDVIPLAGAFAYGTPGTGRADGLEISPDGSKLYYSSATETQLRVFSINPLDGSDLTEEPPVPIPGAVVNDIRMMAVRPDGDYLYIGSRSGSGVHVFDLTGAAPVFVTTIPIGLFTGRPSPSPDNQWLYVAATGSDLIAIVDVRDGSPTRHTVLTTSGGGAYAGNPFASPGLETPAGVGVAIEPTQGASIEFAQVTDGGNTTVTSSNVSSVAVPADFQVDLGGAPVFYDVQTDVSFSGPVEVCFSYPDGVVPDETAIRLLHEVAGTFEDVTTSLDTVNNRVCGIVSSFSQFALGEFVGAIAVDPPSPNVIPETGGSTTFIIRPTTAPTGTVTVPISTSSADCNLGVETSVSFDAGDYPAGVPVTVYATHDTTSEAQEACVIETGAADADDDQPEFDGVDSSDATVLIEDDDSTDLAIAKSDGVAAAAPGASLTVTIVLTNRLSVGVTGAEFEDVLPAEVSYSSSSCSGGTGCAVGESGGTVTGSVDLDAGESATFLVHVLVDSGASGTISNTAEITGFGGVSDLDSGNDSATDETRVADVDPPAVSNVNSFADTGDGTLVENEATELPITQLLVTFDEPVRASDAGSAGKYLLYRAGGDVDFDTTDCTGVAPGDDWVSVDGASYSHPTATLSINGGGALPDGIYRLRVCGTIRDLDGNGLDGGDFVRTFLVDTQPPHVENVNTTDDTGNGSLDGGEATNVAISELRVRFDEPMSPASAAAASNFLLVESGGDGEADTPDCATGLQDDDTLVAWDTVTYDVPTRTTHLVPLPSPLAEGRYRLLVCGTTSVTDLAGRKLDGNADTTAGDDFLLDFVVDQSPPTFGVVWSSHDGGPSADPTIDVWWYGEVTDTLAGVAGFSWEFSTAGAGVCDETEDGTSEATTSPLLTPGDWYFHLCARDWAGNWSAVTTYGPWTVLTPVPTKVAGKFRITVPSGFDVDPPFALTDLNLTQGGVQIDVDVYQTGWAVEFLTRSVTPAGQVSIGSSLAIDELGFAAGGFVLQGRLYAWGFRPGLGQALWTPEFNSPSPFGVRVGGNESVGDNSCGVVTLPSTFNVPGITFVDLDANSGNGRQVRAYMAQGGARPLQVSVRTDDAVFTVGGGPAPGIVLSRTGDVSSDGELDGRCFNVNGRAIVAGMLANETRRYWTPKYNNGQSSSVDYAGTGTKFPVEPVHVPGAISHWRGQGADGGADLVDGNWGGLYNGAGYAPGKIGEAFWFGGAGSNGVFEVPPAANLEGMAEVTISLWVNAADPSSRYQALAGQGPGSLVWGLEITSSGGALGLDFGVATDAAPLAFVSEANSGDGFPFPASTWTHVAGVYDGAELRLYVNGERAPVWAARPLTGAVLSTGGYFSIGSSPGTDDNELDGLIDDVAIFSRALSDAEIQGLYQRRKGGS